MGNSADHTAKESFYMGIIEVTKTKRISEKNRTGTHCKNITYNSTHPRGGTLKRLNGTWMVMRFYLEGYTPPITHINDSRIFFPCFHQNLPDGLLVFFLGGKQAEQLTGIFIGTVFGPHYGKDTKLGQVGFTAQNRKYLLVLLRQNSVPLNQIIGNFDIQNRVRIQGK